jgi:predicted dehydrogenase
VPAGVDYDMWLGPAPKKPFNPNRFHFTFRWYWDYAGGLMTDWGVHMLDMVLFGMKAGAPNKVVAAGGKFAFPNDAMQTPDTLSAVYEFDDFLMTWEHTIGLGRGPYDRPHGVAFNGSNGTLVVDRSGWEVIPEYDPENRKMRSYKITPIPVQRAQGDDRDLHAINFVDCIKSRNTPICDIKNGANVAINAHLGNIAYRLGKKINFNKQSLTFENDQEATQLAMASYRKPWELPKV